MARPPVKAQELADQLAAQIQSGDLKVGSWLPAERQLAESYGVGRSTARQAAQILAEAGLVELVSGSGARVRGGDPEPAEADLREELRVVHRRLAELDARVAALESKRGQSVPEV